MQRRTLLTGLALAPGLATPAIAPALAQAPDRAAIAEVERYFNGLTTLRARFLQISQQGGSAEGTAMIWRPGRMRFEYDPPEPTLLIAADGQFFHWDKELRQASVVPLSATPLGLLLRNPLRLSGDITVEAVERGAGVVRVTLHRTDRAAEGRIQLVLDEAPMVLRQWAVQDSQGRVTRVTLTDMRLGERFDPFQFAFNDPRFREELEQAR
ncbi:LolA family protein [Roseococcus suduntuyensis]|uniref:Outer membrane lipoprotein-sorting protein n=1 Tax=Roseococcus suduntuyensis TaxID=455361 RepID=A0A840A6W2_9PROT|nr:outer membrane lipoprotein carrier protein LolA [Roseococcus suduntuyensis]MBB3896857.1 outer membrane lipoprotein-sorting protein [Roseococcus suduntuyensis]